MRLDGKSKKSYLRIIFLLMDLPINDKELATIITALTLGGDTALYQKLKIVKDVRDANPGGPYKKIIRDTYGMVI